MVISIFLGFKNKIYYSFNYGLQSSQKQSKEEQKFVLFLKSVLFFEVFLLIFSVLGILLF